VIVWKNAPAARRRDRSRVHRQRVPFPRTSDSRLPTLRTNSPSLQHRSTRANKGKIAPALLWLTSALLLALRGLAADRAAISTTHPAAAPLRDDVRPTTYVLAPRDRFSLLDQRFGLPPRTASRANPAVRWDDMKVGDLVLLPLPRSQRLPSEETVKEIRRGLRGLGRVALTFDAGADLGALDDLLDVLKRRRARASFFVSGRWVERYPEALRRIADDGHDIFNHTFTHRALPRLSSSEILDELERTDRIIRQTAGRSSRPYFRPPYGDRNRRVLETAGRAGWQCVYWTLDSRDSVGSAKTPEQIVRRVLSLTCADDPRLALDGAIVLFHASAASTAQAMEPILDGLRRLGLRPVSLPTLLCPPTDR